jgi:ankyrin repeat protein
MSNGGNYGFWIQYIAGGLSPDVVRETSSLYYAASFGYDMLVSAILSFEKALNLEQPGGRHGSTALQVACFRRQRKAVELLVEAGANPFSPDGSSLDGGFSSVFWQNQMGGTTLQNV